MKIWIIIWRFSPPHIWHIKLIKKSLWENHNSIVILWSSNIKNQYNIFSFKERKLFLEKIFGKKIQIKKSNDYKKDEDWYKEISEILKKYDKKQMVFYWWDLENDSAIKILKEFWDFKNINFRQEDRKKININSTQIRQYLNQGEFKKVKKYIPNEIYKEIVKSF